MIERKLRSVPSHAPPQKFFLQGTNGVLSIPIGMTPPIEEEIGSAFEDYFCKYEINYLEGLSKIHEEIRDFIQQKQRDSDSSLEPESRTREICRYYQLMEFSPSEPNLGDIYQKFMHVQLEDFPFCVLIKNNRALKGKNMVLLEGFSINLDHGDQERLAKIIVYASKSARTFGVKPGMTYSEGIEKCPNLLIPKFDLNECRKACLNFFKAVTTLTLQVESGSCDEAIVDVSYIMSQGVMRGYSTMDHLVFTMQHLVYRSTGGLMPVIGLARSRILARLAVRQARKRNKYDYFLQDKYVKKFMWGESIGELPMTKSAVLTLKQKYQIFTCGGILEVGLEQLQKDFGDTGIRLFKYASGEDSDELRRTHWKSVVFESMDLRLKDYAQVLSVLHELARQAKEFLISQHLKGIRITMGVTFEHDGRTDCCSLVVDQNRGHGVAVEPYRDIRKLWSSSGVQEKAVKRFLITMGCIPRKRSGNHELEEAPIPLLEPLRFPSAAKRRKIGKVKPILRQCRTQPDFIII